MLTLVPPALGKNIAFLHPGLCFWQFLSCSVWCLIVLHVACHEGERKDWLAGDGTGDSDPLWPQKTSRLLALWLSMPQETTGLGDHSKYAEVT
jgi:hypothetical protein